MTDPQLVPSPDPRYPAAPATPAYGEIPPRQDEYDAVPPLSQGQRVIDTYFAPSRTFADIRRNRSWWLPYILLVLFSLAFGAVVQQRVGADTLAENAIRNNPSQAAKFENMQPEQRASAMKFTAKTMQVVLFASPLTTLIFVSILALLLWVGFNFILGGTSTYPGMFAVAMYSTLPSLIFYLIVMATLFAGNPENFNLNSMAGTNAGYYMAPGSPVFVKTLLSSLDIFVIWQMILLGLGGAIVARVKKSTGLAMVLGVWFVIILVKAAITAL